MAAPRDAAALLGLYEQLYAITGGRLSPLVGASLERLGYDAAYRLEPSGPPLAAPVWEDALTLVRSADGDLRLDAVAPVTLDVGAAGKGLLVDLVGELLLEHGVADPVVDASGDLRAWGGTGIRVALQNPANASKAIGVVELAEGRALCASALDRRRWGEGLHHIVDAVTGRPVDEGVIGTFAVADSALVADGAATALFLADPHAIGDRLGVEWVRMFANGSIESSADWKGELFR
ncbi:FAD:protein FMN transferase [Microcella daejeonensis]|uniref:FAD:protein FMN transferase n=1 Tax=Microcella daejeonensis TaxID=2994971 RepID=UPI002D1E3FD7|nr:FAD:protein FMN transferase [Microcella daejeonensis]